VRAISHRDLRVAGQTPRRVVLRSSQTIRFICGKSGRNGSVRKRDPSLGWLVMWAQSVRADRQQTAFALDHHVTHIGRGWPHECNASAPVLDAVDDPLRACAGLAPAAAGEDQPRAPVAGRRNLSLTRDLKPRPAYRHLKRGDLLSGQAHSAGVPSRSSRRMSLACSRDRLVDTSCFTGPPSLPVSSMRWRSPQRSE